MMNNYIIEITIIHTSLILAYIVLLSKMKQYFFRRFYLLLSTLFATLIPLLKLPAIYSSKVEAQAIGPIETLPSVEIIESTVVDSSSGIYYVIIGIYLAITLFLFLKTIASSVYVMFLKYQSRRTYLFESAVHVSKQMKGSFSFFNWIFIDEDTIKNEESLKYIMAHEKAHIDYNHTYDLLFLDLFKCLFWWLPTSWYINTEIKHIHEFQADENVIRHFDPHQYSSVLISSVLQSNGLSLSSSFNNGSLHRRLQAMKQSKSNVSIRMYGLTMSFFAVLFVLFACTEERTNFGSIDPVQVQEIFRVVEQHPSYKDGMEAFYNRLRKEIVYPRMAREGNVSGKVYVQFVVERDGTLSNVMAIQGIGSGCDNKAVEVIKDIPAFQPGSQRGRTVRTQMVIPFTFELDQNQKGIISVGEATYNRGMLQVTSSYDEGQWTGTVKDPNGNILPGANIFVAGTNRGTVSNLDGTFKIKASAFEDIFVSFVGYDGVRLKARNDE